MKNVKTSTKMSLSLASVLFFAPFVQNLLNTGHLDIKENDKQFILGYVKYGYLLIGTLLVTMLLGIIQIFRYTPTISYLTDGLLVLIIVGVLVGSAAIISDKELMNSSGQLMAVKTVEEGNSDILMAFLPGYNRFLRYKLHQFDKPFWRVKESIIRRTILTVIWMWGNTLIGSIILLIVILRVASLLWGIDLIADERKSELNQLFTKNIEELRAYPKWLILYAIHAVVPSRGPITLSQAIDQSKKPYNQFFSTKEQTLRIEYAIGWILLGWYALNLFAIQQFETLWVFSFIPTLIIIARYAVLIRYKVLIPIPVIHELIEFAMRTYHRFKK